MNSPLFSVIIPVYNRETTIERAINSVKDQSFKNFELIIVDDGSTDGSSNILSSLSLPFSFKVLRTYNKGVSASRNLGCQSANGEWLAFLDSDDEWLPNKLELQHNVIQGSDHVLVHGEEIWIRNGVRVNQMKKYSKGGGDQFIPSLHLCAISPSTTVIRKDIFEELDGFREDYPVCEDYDLWLKVTSKYPVGFCKEALIKKYGGHDDQLSRKFKAMDYWRVKSLKWILENRELPNEKKDALVNVLSKKCRILLVGYEKHNNMENFQEVSNILEALNRL